MLEKYDTDRSGNLNAEELTQLLAHYDNGVKRDWDEYHTSLVLNDIGSRAADNIGWDISHFLKIVNRTS